MSPCVVVGDSIAVGVGQYRPDCETIAKVGISSEKYIATLLPTQRIMVDTAVISLGVNDGDGLDTLDNLRTVRGRIAAQSVVWLLPGLKPQVRAMIRQVAAEHGDRLVDTRPEAGRDHLHPTGAGYQVIAAETAGADAEPEEVALAEPRAPLHAARHVHAGRHIADRHRPRTPAERIHRLRELRQHELSSRAQPVSAKHRHSIARLERTHAHGRHETPRHQAHASRTHAVPEHAATARKVRRAIELRCGGRHPCVARSARLRS